MSITNNIRKILFISFWCIFGAGILVLLIAAMRVKKYKNCTGYSIEIKGFGEQLFIDKEDIEEQLNSFGAPGLKGRSLKSFDLKKMEEKLEKNKWISVAELFFDNNQVLQVSIVERQPIARVFTVTGISFYIDSSLNRLPLSERISARLPVFTGFPSDKEKLIKDDSMLMVQLKTLSIYLLNNRFWMAQVAQVDITPARTFEIIPTIGNNIIEFGNGTDCEKKFNRLLLFYRQVISETGFNTYERIKVQFSGQVVGVRHAASISKFDSLQAIENVKRLIAMAQTEQERLITMDSIEMGRLEYLTDKEEWPARINDTATKIPINGESKQIREKNSNPESPTLKSPPPYEPQEKSNPLKKQAKAVMKKL